ncbi:MAG: formate--tetrahydrofolate ligase [Spirochaetaceae bacterium]
MAKLDPTKMEDWQIAEEAEKDMKKIYQLAEELGIEEEELLPYGHYLGKVDYKKIMERVGGRKNGKYIEVTAITPTPLGEGKTTTSMGLVEGLGALGKKVTGAIRQPSGGPTFNIKGSAAGGGLSQCIPLSEFSLGLTGDIDAITNAHNLGMVALSSRIQHEFNYGDKTLAKKNLQRLNIDPNNPATGWTIDFSAQALRKIIMGIGGKMDGFMMESGFQITVSSELMAILAVVNDLKDMRNRIAKMTLGYNKKGEPVTAGDLEVDGAMTAIMIKTINPTLMQTLEGQPVFVHAGPFANIAIGQSSVIADKLGLKMSDYHITESGFGADIGFEKFWNLKTRYSGLTPDASVIVATIRAIKMHGGGPTVTPGKPLDEAYTKENTELVEKGVENLVHHIETVKKSGITPVVAINDFPTDTEAERKIVREAAEKAGAKVALSRHWLKGGEGARELAEAVIEAAEEPGNFKRLYDGNTPTKESIERIAKEVYGADGVTYSEEAEKKLKRVAEDPEVSTYGVCVAKTQQSLSHDPSLKGRPKGWTLPIKDVSVYHGAELIVPFAGDIKLMPGTASDPAYRRIDVDTESGKVKGMF